VTDSKPSKSARKREFAELQLLGEKLVELTDGQLLDMVDDQRLVDAVRQARSMNSHSARRRQNQLIGKIMRDIDAEPIQRALESLNRQPQLDNQVFRQAERWRDRLLGEGSAAIAEFRVLAGNDCDALQKHLRDYASSNRDAARKTAARQLFREVHAKLQAKMQRRGL
jgi:ribosome-associated protein